MKKATPFKSLIKINTSVKGERLEEKIDRIMNNKEPITDPAPVIYTERSEGVIADYDIRTNKMEYAMEAMDKATKSHRAKRTENIKKRQEAKEKTSKKETESQSTQTTDSQNNQ